ncbi:MAG TPA: LCP family protein [Candidatus Cybelea sp.]|jgi:LCP family protein required for cell wall assembly|nr:LCP family protein [Candidatus Cybelea sp.]
MLFKPWFRVAAVAFVAIVSITLGFLLFRAALRQQIVSQTARSSFGQVKLNLLILGYQADEAATDTILLAHLDAGRRTATLVSIPRDTWVPIAGHGVMKINSAYAYGGPHASARAIAKLMGGIPIDAIVALQPEGAAQLVDAMGGLDVDVDEDMDYDDSSQDLHIHLRKGQQHLTGSQVAGYVRFRHDPASDFGRMKRQQHVLRLIIDQLSEPQNWTKLPKILTLARKQVNTTLNNRQLVSLLTVYRNVPDDNVRSFTLPSRAGWVGDASVVFADQRWAKLIGTLLFGRSDPPQDEVLVVNATGNAAFDRTIVGALRGAGWNVPNFVEQKQRRSSVVIGGSPAALRLAKTFATATRPGAKTALVIGADLAPDLGT